MYVEKTYFDLLASLDETLLRRAIDAEIAYLQDQYSDVLRDESFDAMEALNLNESQAHVIHNCMSNNWQSADDFFAFLRTERLAFDIGYDADLPGFYYDEAHDVVLACNQWIDVDGCVVTESADGTLTVEAI